MKEVNLDRNRNGVLLSNYLFKTINRNFLSVRLFFFA